MRVLETKNIAYIGGQGIGDLVISIPILRKLKESFPEATTTYICVSSKYGNLLRDCPCIDGVFEINKRLFKFPDQMMDLRKKRFDLAVLPAPNEKVTRVFAKLIKTKRLAVSNQNILGEENIVDTEFSTLEQIGIFTNRNERKLKWPFGPSEFKPKINKILKENKINKQDLLIGIHAGADKKLAANLWLSKRWTKVVKYLIEKLKAKVIFIGGEEDSKHTKKIINSIKRKDMILNLVGRLSIKESAALIDRCKLFISTNSGPMWIAAALHKTQIVLSGPSLVQWNPYNDKAIVIRKKINRKGCWPPCGSRSNTKCKYKDNLCMKSIKVEDVIQAIEKIKK